MLTTYDGQTNANGALQYQAATYGIYQTAPEDGYIEQNDSFVAQIDVFDKTTNGVCASVVVKSVAFKNWSTRSENTFDLTSGITQGSLAMQFQPNHEYQVRAHWDCSMHQQGLHPAYFMWLYDFAVNATLCVQGLAITFD